MLRTHRPVPGIARFQRAPDSLANKNWSVADRFLNPIDRFLELYSITAPNFRSTHDRIIVIPFYFDRRSLLQFVEAVGCAHKPCDEGTVMQDAG